jgi:hypothetical protein
MRQRTRHRGYVLLLTLLVLTIAAAALAGMCRLALEKATQAARAQEALQRRWGVVTCRAAMLPKAPLVFASFQPAGDRNLAESRMSLNLGGQSLTLVFGDEQAKANLNLLYALEGRAGADRLARDMAQAAGATAMLRVELRPVLIEPPDDEPVDNDTETDRDPEALLEFTVEQAFEAWGQVFPGAAPQDLVRRRGPLPSAVENITCWGDGLVNVRRASREAVQAACARWLRPAEVAKLLAARDKDVDFDLWETLDSLDLSEARRDAAEQLLTDESTCYSLWIITRTRGRDGYDLAVADFANSRTTGVRVFSW